MKIHTFLILSLVLLSCQSPQDEREILYDQVMTIHDEAMAEMGTINSLRKTISDSMGNDTALNKSYMMQKSIRKLDLADSIMWDWMHNFDQEAASESSDTAIQYLKREEKRIKYVQEVMDSAIQYGKDIIEGQ